MRGLIAELISAPHQVTLADMEAGLEHLSRSGGTLRYIDQLLIVTEPDRKAIETARRTSVIARELGIPRMGLIGNQVRDAAEEQDIRQLCSEAELELLALIPYDEAVRQADRRGAALYDYDRDCPTVHALEALVTHLERQFELLPARVPPASPPVTPAPAAGGLEGPAAVELKKRFPECD